MIGPETYLKYRNYRHLKLSVGLLALAVLAYGIHDPIGGPSGGSWLGYTYGTVCAVLVMWLTWFGVRKRTYGTSGTTLAGWLSAHVYLGVSLVLLVPLHAGFQFGRNVHTLAYALLAAVVLSGIVGVERYARVPARMTRNRMGLKREVLLQQIAELDQECRLKSTGVPDSIASAVEDSIRATRIGGSALTQISGRGADYAVQAPLDRISDYEEYGSPSVEESLELRELSQLLLLKRKQLRRIQRDVRDKAFLDLWLILHVPLAVATLVAIAIHVFVVFYYW